MMSVLIWNADFPQEAVADATPQIRLEPLLSVFIPTCAFSACFHI